MTLRDAVRTASNSVSKASRDLALISQDSSLPLAERLTALRKIAAHDVGDTWLRRSRGLERDFDQSNLYLKFEGENPTGTQKDRIAFAHAEDALEKGATTISFATCGNYGVAVALAARLVGIPCRIYVPAGYHTKRLVEMEAQGGIILRPPGSYEEVVDYSSQEASRNGWYDANPGQANSALQLRAYSHIADELLRQLGEVPATVAVPVSNGTLMAGIFHGFVRLRDAGTIRQLPRMIAASSTHKNPIVSSFLAGSRTCVDLDPVKITESDVNEPLINWHSFDGQEALDALHASGGGARHVSDAKMRKLSTYLSQKEALQVLPASTAGLIALLEAPAAEQGLRVAVLTAKR
ncbi:Tryptophan synthase beta chain [Neolewinella maritima]|uniref:Tryptophan synthase beta chain n=1 Tax=Neolewinella maritima TaxID=1383882 RepID=A0ABM9AZP5_9BACT|nr:pyridoxal-phosphate dependent enzyme [Neolewinella maritima]CAH1000326.1 Tryptophan synthase beta chain [Neolewinella maritima]